MFSVGEKVLDYTDTRYTGVITNIENNILGRYRVDWTPKTRKTGLLYVTGLLHNEEELIKIEFIPQHFFEMD